MHMNVWTNKEVFLGKKTYSGSFYIRQFNPSPSPQAVIHGLRGQQVK